MESGEDSYGSSSMKRQREPLSDTEDNELLPSGVKDGQKRRRLELAGQENRSPKASSSRRLAELEVKPDTPALPSVRSRVQQLTQRREGGPILTQRCLSDPGSSDSTSVLLQDRGFRQNLLGEGEFSQRVGRFKSPIFQPSPGPGPSPANPCPRTLSNFVSDIQQKLQGNETPSSKQASRIRQEREQELRLLCSQPINDNAWLKRSNSDPSLAESTVPPASSTSWIPSRHRRRVQWPLLQPWDQAEDNAGNIVAAEAESSPEMTDGSFTEASTSRNKLQVKQSGEKAACDSPAPALPIELKDASSNEREEREVEEEREEADSTLERRQGNPQSHSQHVPHSTVMAETEREGCTSSGSPQRQLVSVEEQGKGDSVPVLDCQPPVECVERREPGEASEGAGEREEKDEGAAGMKEGEERSTVESPIGVEQKIPEELDSVANMGSESSPEEESDDEEAMEPSTDDELRRWCYPGHREHVGEESSIAEEEEDTECTEGGEGERGSCADKNEKKHDVADHIDIKQENTVEDYDMGEEQTGQPRITDVVEVVMEMPREDGPKHTELYINEVDAAQTMINTQISKGDDQKDIEPNAEDVVQAVMEIQASAECLGRECRTGIVHAGVSASAKAQENQEDVESGSEQGQTRSEISSSPLSVTDQRAVGQPTIDRGLGDLETDEADTAQTGNIDPRTAKRDPNPQELKETVESTSSQEHIESEKSSSPCLVPHQSIIDPHTTKRDQNIVEPRTVDQHPLSQTGDIKQENTVEDYDMGEEQRSEISSSPLSVTDQRAVGQPTIDGGPGDLETDEADTAQTGDIDPRTAKRDPNPQELKETVESTSSQEHIESEKSSSPCLVHHQSIIDPHTTKRDQNIVEPRTIDQHPLSQTGDIKQENTVEDYDMGEEQTGQPRITDVVEVVMETPREDGPKHTELYINEVDAAQTMINTQISKGDDQKDIEPNAEDVVQAVMEIQASTEDNPGHIELHINEVDTAQAMINTQISKEDNQKDIEPNRDDIVQAVMEIQASTEDNPADTEHNRTNITDTLTEAQATGDHQEAEGEMEPPAAGKEQGGAEVQTGGIQTGQAHQSEGRGVLKKVTFILEPELINDSAVSEMDTSSESRGETSVSEAELCSHDETNTAEMIDQMFGEVLEYAEKMEEGTKRGDGDRDSGIGTGSVDKERMDTESEKEKSEGEEEFGGEEGSEESKKLDTSGEELLMFPPSGILSPLSKSVEAVVTPLRLAANQLSNPPSLLLTPEEELTTPPPDSAPLYSIDAYRTQRQRKLPAIQSVTPGVQRRAQEKSRPQPSINTKEKILALTEEAVKLQTVINQTLQALSCCTDEDHGRGSLEEAEAEKLLLVSCEKRSAQLAEVVRLREESGSESEEAGGRDFISQQPCRGTVGISNVQLPLKVEFVCSSRNRKGRPSHYFFVLIRYGPCNIVATPLATAADAQNGDTISFSTSVTLKDIRSNFEIDVEVYSLSHTSGNACNVERSSAKPRVTPRKLLSTITHRSNNSMASAALPAMSTRRSSNFCLVGSHKITLASLGQSKFPLDKMKFEGKIRKLLGDEFQEKVPFLSPLEGNIYLRLDSQNHSNVQHQGFLTMFEVLKGFGVWHRRYFVLEGYHMLYWNHPNDRESKAAEGSIYLSSFSSQSVKPVKRDSCARPFTFELVSNIQALQQEEEDSQNAIAKCWFSADTKQERSDWMDKLNQVLLDLHTWSHPPLNLTDTQQTSSSSNLRESIL